ncbi:helix-turn-helix transcriptional regulator [Nonomuraea sp. NPDC050663]|uniref:helix-turn-helix transcriptional regulator n=1 Tax=Nonomuraea sp. NPDC050663 TaxID=3364370 RepID=UPI00378925AF
MRVGGFRREAAGQNEFLDAAHGYFCQLGAQGRFLDIPGLKVRYTWLDMTPEMYSDHVEGAERWNGWLISTGTVLDLHHRELLMGCRRGLDQFELAERLLVLLEFLPPRTDRPGTAALPQIWAAHRRLASHAQEALASSDSWTGLAELAAVIGSSPHHLSRVFRQVTGRTLTDYRNELRVRAVMEHLAEGSESLADLAARLGFVDHTHMTRTVRRYLGQTPSKLRELLSTKVLGH